MKYDMAAQIEAYHTKRDDFVDRIRPIRAKGHKFRHLGATVEIQDDD